MTRTYILLSMYSYLGQENLYLLFFCSSSSIANDAVRTRLRRKFSFVRFDVNQMIFLSQKKRYDPGLEHATIELTLFKMAASYIFLEKDDFIILKTRYQRMKI